MFGGVQECPHTFLVLFMGLWTFAKRASDALPQDIIGSQTNKCDNIMTGNGNSKLSNMNPHLGVCYCSGSRESAPTHRWRPGKGTRRAKPYQWDSLDCCLNMHHNATTNNNSRTGYNPLIIYVISSAATTPASLLTQPVSRSCSHWIRQVVSSSWIV